MLDNKIAKIEQLLSMVPSNSWEDVKYTALVREAAPELIAEIKALRQALRWYVDNDDTNEGGKWEDYNAGWLEGKRRAMKLLGMEDK